MCNYFRWRDRIVNPPMVQTRRLRLGHEAAPTDVPVF
jgi:hypothetical protein